MRSILPVFALLSVACGTEYKVGDALGFGVSNPFDLSTPTQTDRVIQAHVPEVDILWVIDNSCSMSDEQSALASNFPSFIQFFLGSGLDYHIGVISMDVDNPMHSGKLRSQDGELFLTSESPTAGPTFARMAMMGTSGSDYEHGREAAWLALGEQRDDYNAGWYRDDATLHIIAISDEEDDTTEAAVPLQEFGQYLLGLKSSDDYVSWSSIVNPASCTYCEVGTEYLTLTENVGGIAWDIRTDDWSRVLEALGMNAAGMSREFFLSRLPDVGSIQVYSEDDEGRTDWVAGDDWTYSYERNSVKFLDALPGPRSEVFIRYDVKSSIY